MKGLAATVGGMLLLFGMARMANAALIDRGFRLIYDPDFDITWLDVSTETLTWEESNTWIDGLNAAKFLGYEGWRLPAIYPANGSSFHFHTGFDGSTDSGYNITAGELGHLFYTELENLARYDSNAVEQPGYGLSNTSWFNHLHNFSYWYGGSGYPFSSTTAPYFGFNDGGQSEGAGLYNTFYALAVHDGDIGNSGSVPEPSTILLILTSFSGLLGASRRRRTEAKAAIAIFQKT